jgi:Outer membrane protein and related peptidoglycan-associated (lipo)proteins
MRNFEAAAKKAGGTIEGQWPGWCKANYDSEGMPDMGNSCTSFGMTMKFVKGGKETWAFFQASESDGSYLMTVSEREAMKQEVAVHEIADQLKKDGFVSLYVTFDTGEATISPDSAKLLDDAAAALKAVPEMKIEVGGHTDNVGSADANLKLSRERAQAVMAALAGAGGRGRPADGEGVRADGPRRRQPHRGRAREEPARRAREEVGAAPLHGGRRWTPSLSLGSSSPSASVSTTSSRC